MEECILSQTATNVYIVLDETERHKKKNADNQIKTTIRRNMKMTKQGDDLTDNGI